jgi:mannose-6-phosphate isomerase-like protein (cupin superfamily)
MDYLRKVDFDAYERAGYEWQYLYHGESCTVIGSNVPAHAQAPPNHVHPVDQLYYVVLGEMQLQLGTERFVAGPDTLVYIPAGTPHHNWNDGDVDEFHFEVLAPAPMPNQTIMTPTESTDAGGRPYRVRALADAEVEEPLPGFTMQRLLRRADSSEHVSLYIGSVEPGAGGPGTHIHGFDQFYFVLDGTMTAEIGLERHVADPFTLVVLPAGVPHRQFNEADATERHITLIVPEPSAGTTAWDVGVTLAATGEVHA